MIPEEAINIATRHQVYLERLKTQEALQFASLVDDLGKRIREVIGKLDVDNVSQLGRRQLQRVLRDLQDVQGSVISAGERRFMGRLQDIAQYEAGYEAKAIRTTLSAKQVRELAIRVPTLTEAYRRAYDQPVQATGQLLEPFVKRWGASHIEGVNNVVRRSWAQGDTVGSMVRQIRGTQANRFQDGILQTSRRQAEAVARTAVQHTANAGRMATWEKNKDIIKGYRFVATLDSRTTTTCRSLDGQIFKMGKGPVPPLHIGCRSTTVPDMDDDLDFLDGGATRAAKGGPVAADTTYYEWLKTQNADFQKDALGSTRAKLFREGGLSAEQFRKLNLDRNFKPLTLEEMARREPLVFKRAGVSVRGSASGPNP